MLVDVQSTIRFHVHKKCALTLFCALLVLLPKLLHGTPEKRVGFDFSLWSDLAIENHGRIKPLDTFARESLRKLSHKESWGNMSAMEVFFGLLFTFSQEYQHEPFIRMDLVDFKKAIHVQEDAKYFSPYDIRMNQTFQTLVRQAIDKKRENEPLVEMEKEALLVQTNLMLLDSILNGEAVMIFPKRTPSNDESWLGLETLSNKSLHLYYDKKEVDTLEDGFRNLVESFIRKDAAKWNATSRSLVNTIKSLSQKNPLVSPSLLSLEVFFNKAKPFRVAWILETICLIFIFLFHVFSKKQRLLLQAGLGFLILGFLTHLSGIIMRCIIAGRPPVTNMYESIVWVSWGAVFFSFILYFFYKKWTVPISAIVFSVCALIFSDNMATVLSPSIDPLEPVLRSNFWLTIHVLTITLSYAAFSLSLCLGNYALSKYFMIEKKDNDGEYSFDAIIKPIEEISNYMYRSIQIGVILLALGTILGGIWADYSWGRFWGWDPKEVWALVALLLYIALLHSRFTGLIKGFGFIVGGILCYLGVLMAWYGVNFVLGAGLHSYGFGKGGLTYVLSGIGVEILFILLSYQQAKKIQK